MRMSDPYIDQYETLAYGPFAAQQIVSLVVGLDSPFDAALAEGASRITAATLAMDLALKKSGQAEVTTYQSQDPSDDPLAQARDVIGRVVKYAESRPKGAELAKQILNGSRLSTVQRRRPVKLLGALSHAIATVTQEQAKLAEAPAFLAELTAAKVALEALDQSVRGSRLARRQMTPEVAACRATWLTHYTAAKRLVEAVLRYQGRLELMREVFDDLAETHLVKGVTDDAAEAESEA